MTRSISTSIMVIAYTVIRNSNMSNALTFFLDDPAFAKATNRLRREKMKAELGTGAYLSLWKYVEHAPERFYARQAAQDIGDLLEQALTHTPRLIDILLSDFRHELETGLRTLGEINTYAFHEIEVPSDEYEQMRRLDRDFLPTYLRLVEGPFAALILPFAVHQRLQRGKQLDGFDVYNRAEELQGTAWERLAQAYENTIRNAIAHGGVRFLQHDVEFSDRKRSITRDCRGVVRQFDELVDVCNGLALGLWRFFLDHEADLARKGPSLPRSVLLGELQAQAEAPGWNVSGCLESEPVSGKPQLNIYVSNRCMRLTTVQYYAMKTAVLAEKHAPGFSRYWMRLASPYGWARLGWAGFDGPRLRELRERAMRNEDTQLVEYGAAIDSSGIFFVPAVKLPEGLLRLGSLLQSFRVAKSDFLERFRVSLGLPDVEIRKVTIHRNGVHCVVNGCVVIRPRPGTDLQEFLRHRCRWVVRRAVRTARKRVRFRELARHLRTGYAHLSIYCRDFRSRHLGANGLIPDLVGTIEFKRLKRVRTIDINGGQPETVSGCRIVWNRAWFEGTASATLQERTST